jgi:hypothetical protein
VSSTDGAAGAAGAFEFLTQLLQKRGILRAGRTPTVTLLPARPFFSMRSLATTRDGTAAFVCCDRLLHWQLSAGPTAARTDASAIGRVDESFVGARLHEWRVTRV